MPLVAGYFQGVGRGLGRGDSTQFLLKLGQNSVCQPPWFAYHTNSLPQRAAGPVYL